MRVLAAILLFVSVLALADDGNYTAARAAMVEELWLYAKFVDDADEARISKAVMASMNTVKRHELVPRSERRYAYENRPLPIGYGQTISQPYIVALMTQLIDVDADDVVLEVGTGSGYQAAILAELVGHVYSIEIIPALAIRAKQDLERLGYKNIITKLGDGYYGWEEHAPFDAIIVTAAASHVPPPLIDQLKPGGRMVIPVGERFMTQTLLLLEKTEKGEVISRQHGAVRFVPLTGEH
ncbi:MAG: protein-L-isoaspartate(D-aspartate) O-methyltransferase [Gammaproteobacteria bacterium]|nr:protein-L-isoaspartate(D-aspartate) O-methyltransferase [Gammaproteobacteria bacterium]MDH3362870.1 protein-L-isoaspartate(D-aspartate) O-methyltransferase [Gammaproteobacteria bacterium]MDH3480680.1 protein-L-isoaspartate(D-aspartate) O-methyltransferase [Gammaproteobacteria bacterium]